MKLLLVEDDERAASYIIKGLRQEGYSVDHATNGQDGLIRGLTGEYDVAVVDLMMPQMDGLTMISRLRAGGVTFPILILSAKNTVDDRVRGLKAGGDDYLVKPFAFSELSARLEALTRRIGGPTTETELHVANLHMDLIRRKVFRDAVEISLPPLEFSLLEYLMRNAGRVVSKTMIMEHVWEYNFDPQTNVVEVRVCHIREKVDRSFEPKLIHTVRGCGYVLEVR